MVFRKNASMCIKKEAILINHDCLPMLMFYIVLAYLMLMLLYLMLFVCIMHFFLLIFANAFCYHACLGLLTHSLFISSMIFHHAQCF